MDSARDGETRQTVNIMTLIRAERRAPGAFERARAEHAWECPSCAGKAWPVSPAKNGRSAKFAAKHGKGCPQRDERVTHEPGYVDPQKQPVENLGTTLRLVFEHGGRGGAGEERHADGQDLAGTGRTGRGHGDGERRRTQERTHRLGSLLRHLVADPHYVEGLGEQRIEVPERGLVRPEHLIWALDDLDPENENMVGRHVIVWGRVFSAKARPGQEAGTGVGFFNQGGWEANKGAIVVGWPTLTELIERYARHGAGTFEDFDKWFVLAYGKASTMRSGQQVGIRPADASMVALFAPRTP